MHPEARQWLCSNANVSAFAGNRFHTTGRALDFVETLYAAGATEVLIDNILTDHVDTDGGPYADTLIVRFSDERARGRLRELCEEAIGDIDGDGRVDEYPSEFHVWWD